jgi:hypothetical protein
MKQKTTPLFLIGLLLLLLPTITGCDELDPDKFIYVAVSVRALVGVYDTGEDLPEMHVKMWIEKDGATKIERQFTTNEDGWTDYLTHTVQVYNQQNVVVKGNLLSTLPQNLIDKGYTVVTFDREDLSWERIRQYNGWGSTYTWNTQLNFLANYEP